MLHLWRLVVDADKLLAEMKYLSKSPFIPYFAINLIATKSIPRINIFETKSSALQDLSSRPWILSNSVKLQRVISLKWTWACDPKLDPCVRADSTVKICLFKSLHRLSAYCQACIYCMELIMPSHKVVFAIKLLNKYSNIIGNATVCTADELYFADRATMATKELHTLFKAYGGLLPVQTFPVHLTQFVSKLIFDLATFEKALPLCYILCPEKWYAR